MCINKEFPKIHLVIDNCFASMRCTPPREWMKIIKDMGLKYAEVSAGNECDPLYSPADYHENWKEEVLNDPALYREILEDLYERLASIAVFAYDRKLSSVGLEQMYTPHQVPWTICGTYELLTGVYRCSGKP